MDARPWESSCCNQALAFRAKHRPLHGTARERARLCLQQGKDIGNCEGEGNKAVELAPWNKAAASFQVLRDAVGLWPTQRDSQYKSSGIKAVSPAEGGNMMTLVIVTRLKQPGGGSFLKYQIGKLHNHCPEPSNRA